MDEDPILLNIERETSQCDMKMLSVTEGFYITEDDKALKLEKAETEENLFNKFGLADSDRKDYTLLDMHNKARLQLCMITTAMLRVFSLMDDRFTTIRDQANKEVVLYIKDRTLFKPSCRRVNEIRIDQENVKSCFRDLKATFAVDNVERTGYLTANSGIIRTDTVKLNQNDHCRLKRTFRIAGTDLAIESLYRNNTNTNWFIVKRWVDKGNVDLFDKNDVLDLSHDQAAVKGVDVASEIQKKYEVQIISSHLTDEESPRKDEGNSLIANARKFIKDMIQKLSNAIWVMGLTSICVIILLVILVMVYYRCGKSIRSLLNRKEYEQYELEPWMGRSILKKPSAPAMSLDISTSANSLLALEPEMRAIIQKARKNNGLN